MQTCNETEVAADLFFHIVNVHASEWSGLLKKMHGGTWFFQLVIDWRKADELTVSVLSIVRKGRSLCRLND